MMIEIDPKKKLGRILPKEINNLTNFKYYNYLYNVTKTNARRSEFHRLPIPH